MRSLAAALDGRRPYRVFDRPIFILSAPRSGSTYLFDLLSKFSEVWHWHAELDDIWWTHFPYQRSDAPSDFIAGSELTPELGRCIRRDHYRYAYWAREERGEPCNWSQKLGRTPVRFLDKTIANCFHLEILDQIFPEALYLFLVRDPRATISSMMEGWSDPVRFAKPQLQPHFTRVSATIPHWSYPAPRGWQSMTQRPLQEICAWSWRQHVESADAFLKEIPPHRHFLVKYETLLADPGRLASELGDFCGLDSNAHVEQFIAARPVSRTAVTAPDQDKWRKLNGSAIANVMDSVAPLMQRYGYGSN